MIEILFSVVDFASKEIDTLYNSRSYNAAYLSYLSQQIKSNLQEARCSEYGCTDIIYFFQHSQDEIILLPSLVKIREDFLEETCKLLFKNNKKVKRIKTSFLYNEINLSFPQNERLRNSNVILSLPKSVDNYLLQLGKTTRKHILYYDRRIQNTFKEVKFNISEDSKNNYKIYNTIIGFNNERLLKKKGIKSQNKGNEEELDSLNGSGSNLISYLELDGQIVAGCYIWRTENGFDFYMNSIGSSIMYDKYNVGQVCMFKTICWCIEETANNDVSAKFHFLWQMNDYKKRFGGELHLLYSYYIYPFKNKRYYVDALKIAVQIKMTKILEENKVIRKMIDSVRRISAKM